MARPTKYKKEYCEEIIEFFSKPPFFEREIEYRNKDGDVYKTEFKREANSLPFISAFARKIGVCRDTINEWTKKHKEFSDSLKKAKELQKEFLITNGLLGLYQPTFAIFTAKNITDMRDQKQVAIEGEIKHPYGVIEVPPAIVGIKR